MKNGGGSAFPGGESYTTTDLAGNKMSHSKGPMYPGMSLRDWFAGQAIPCVNDNFSPVVGEKNEDWAHWLARTAYAVADAMLAEREKA